MTIKAVEAPPLHLCFMDVSRRLRARSTLRTAAIFSESFPETLFFNEVFGNCRSFHMETASQSSTHSVIRPTCSCESV